MSSKFVKDVSEMSFGKQIKVFRAIAGMNQSEFGHLLEVSQRTLSNIENEVPGAISKETRKQVRNNLIANGFLNKTKGEVV